MASITATAGDLSIPTVAVLPSCCRSPNKLYVTKSPESGCAALGDTKGGVMLRVQLPPPKGGSSWVDRRRDPKVPDVSSDDASAHSKLARDITEVALGH